MTSLCTQESFDAIGLDKAIEELNQELLDAAASVDDSRPPSTSPKIPLEAGLFMGVGDLDTIMNPGLSFIVPTRIGPNAQAIHTGARVDERRDIYMSHKYVDLLPFAPDMYSSLITEHASRSYWNGEHLRPQVRSHVTPQEVEPPAGTYGTWIPPPLVTSDHIRGIMEAVIDSGMHFSVSPPITAPVVVIALPASPSPPSARLVRSPITTLRPVLVKQKAISYSLAERTAQTTSTATASGAAAPARPKGTRKKAISTSQVKSTVTGRFPCTKNCGHVCNSSGDLKRHLQSLAHQPPSIPCPNGCGNLFTREDAAERHGRSRKCPKL